MLGEVTASFCACGHLYCMQVHDVTEEGETMAQSTQADSRPAQVCFRCSQASADLLNELAGQHVHGLRGLVLSWLAQAGYAEVAQQDLARPDGRRRQRHRCSPLPPTEGRPK
jgi:hypothetical protein